jgi:hypothetical protein
MTVSGHRHPLGLREQAALERLPPGTIELGAAYLARAGRAIGRTATIGDLEAEAADHILRPLILVDDWPDPTDPLPVGAGAVHADLIDADTDALARLRETLAESGHGADGSLDAEHLAAEAQLWRLAVTPYRRRNHARARAVPGLPPTETVLEGAVGPSWPKPLSDCVVLDLSALWAGPLATSLLAADGARVIKLDPSCRPDAFGVHRHLYQHLNGGKEIVDLDLRLSAHKDVFEQLVIESDLLVDSFSRRVMPNLGYGPDQLRALNPSLVTLSIAAFPAGTPEAGWISYGPGVHATSGLADSVGDPSAGRVRYRPAPIAYPDALAALAAYALAVEVIGSPVVGGAGSRHVEVSLLSAIAPLLVQHPRTAAAEIAP